MVAALFAWGWALDFSLIILEIPHLTSLPYFGLIFPISIKKTKTKTLLGAAYSEGQQTRSE